MDGRLHWAWLLRQDSCPLGVLWNYYGDAGRGDTQEEMDAYNEFNTFGVDMDNPVAPWFVNGDYFGFRFSVFAISIPRLRAHAGAVASSRLVRRDLYSFCFSSVPPTAARPGSAPQATCYSAVLRIRATFKARPFFGLDFFEFLFLLKNLGRG